MNPIAFKKFDSISTIAEIIFACVVVTLASSIFCEATVAQDKSKSQSKVESYLKKKDANQNGKVEPEEMSESTKSYLTKMGYDVNKSVTISKVVAKADKAGRERGREQARTKADLKVPGFGSAADSGTGVRSFSTTEGGNSKSAVKKNYSSSVREQTEQTLERYDRNRDGNLDSSEMERARWGSPRPSISDLNRDGKLSRAELNERYAARENPSTSSSSSREEDRSRSTSSRSRPSSSSSRRDSTSRSSSNTSESGSSKSKGDDRAKYIKYAQSMVESYDKDKDGKLNKTELKKMRRPPVGADANGDGFVTDTELADNLSGANKNKTASNDKDKDREKDKGASMEARKASNQGRSTTSSRPRTSSSLGKLDTNGDNQVQMHEFAEKWDDDVVAEYYEKDKNGDGVITAAEWSSRN